MKELFFKFCEKFLAGIYSVKLRGGLYLNFPKIAPIFTLAIILYAIGETKQINNITNISYALIVLGFFGFFYYNIFPSRLPKR